MCSLSVNHLKRAFYSSPSLDNFVYKLCYRWTVLFLAVFSVIVTCKLWLGDSFACAPNDVFPPDYTQKQCYDDTPYILPAKLVIQTDGVPVVEPGVEKLRRYQTYYPWVNLLFLAQAFAFCLPYIIWKSYEGGYIRKLTAGIENTFDNDSGGKHNLEQYRLARYIVSSQGKHKWYAVIYLVCELYNFAFAFSLAVSVVQFFGVTGVPDFLPIKVDTWTDFRNFYFPSSGYCELTSEAKSGTTVCRMPLNQLYMYMFVFIHCWYIFIAIVTGMVLVYRSAAVAKHIRTLILFTNAKFRTYSVIRFLCLKMSYSDWFFLTRLQRVMLDLEFAQLLDKIALLSLQDEDKKDDDTMSTVSEVEMQDIGSSGTTIAVENVGNSDTEFAIENVGNSDTAFAIENVGNSDTAFALENAGNSDTSFTIENVGNSDTAFALENVGNFDAAFAIENVGNSDTAIIVESASGTDRIENRM